MGLEVLEPPPEVGRMGAREVFFHASRGRTTETNGRQGTPEKGREALFWNCQTEGRSSCLSSYPRLDGTSLSPR